MDNKWTGLQRDFLRYLANFLPSIHELIAIMGADALQVFCVQGYLSQEIIDNIEIWRNTTPGEVAMASSATEDASEDEGDEE